MGDWNGNGIISVAETHKFIEEHGKDEGKQVLKVFIDPNTEKAKQPPLIRAWAKITGYVGGGKDYTAGHKDGFIHKNEFKHYLHLCFLYNELFLIFEDCAEGERKVTLDEFRVHAKNYVANSTDEDLEKAFKIMDKNEGGEILFDEFCRYLIAALDL